MISLNDKWKAQTQERQQDVQVLLAGFQVERNQIATQLREHLRIFQDEIRQETRVLLENASQQRQEMALELSERLSDFRAQLQEQTAQFLAVTEAERSLMAQQVTYDLSEFRQQLAESVALLRQDLQIGIEAIASEVQTLRSNTQQELTALRQDRLSNLVTLVDGLRADTQDYLAELTEARKERADQLHGQLQANRAHRQAEAQMLRQQFAHFRLGLRQHRARLRQSVWGEGTVESSPSNGTASATALPTATPKSMPLSLPRPSRPASSKALHPKTSRISAKPLTTGGRSPHPIASTSALTRKANGSTPPISIVEMPPVPEVAVPHLSAQISGRPVELGTTAISPLQSDQKPVSSTANANHLQRDAAQTEAAIHAYIHEVKGARLTEIETALGMNRFQAVDALRSLIKKGLVTQRDRTYLAQD